MQFAQKDVSLERGASRGVRGLLRGADVCEYADAVGASWDASFVQLSAGHLDAGIEFLAGDRFVLYRERWSQRLHTVGTILPGMIAFGIPDGTGVAARWWGRSLRDGRLPFLCSNGELNLVTEAGEAITVLAMMEKDFRGIFDRLTGLDSTRFLVGGQFFAAKPDAVLRLRAFWGSILARTALRKTCDLGIADLVAPLLDAMELPVRAQRSTASTAGLLDRVMHAEKSSNYGTSVPELSMRLKISRRSVEYAFQENLGISPQAYFTLRRLDLCQRALIEANPEDSSVTDIAMQYGFHELGRFAAIYRRQFGELPSETLRMTRCMITARVSPIRSCDMPASKPSYLKSLSRHALVGC